MGWCGRRHRRQQIWRRSWYSPHIRVFTWAHTRRNNGNSSRNVRNFWRIKYVRYTSTEQRTTHNAQSTIDKQAKQRFSTSSKIMWTKHYRFSKHHFFHFRNGRNELKLDNSNMRQRVFRLNLESIFPRCCRVCTPNWIEGADYGQRTPNTTRTNEMKMPKSTISAYWLPVGICALTTHTKHGQFSVGSPAHPVRENVPAIFRHTYTGKAVFHMHTGAPTYAKHRYVHT